MAKCQSCNSRPRLRRQAQLLLTLHKQSWEMYNPKQTGFFPLIQLKIEESLSQTEKSEYLKLPSLEDKIQWLNKLPRVSSDHQDNILKAIVKPNHGVKSKEKSVQNREAGNSQFYAANFKQAQILYSMAVFSAPAPSKESNDLALAFANRYTMMLFNLDPDNDFGLKSGRRVTRKWVDQDWRCEI